MKPPSLRHGRVALAVLASTCLASAASGSPDPAANAAEAAPALVLKDLWVQGGWAMWPLLACSTAALLLLVQGVLDTRRARCVGRDGGSGWLADCLRAAEGMEGEAAIDAFLGALGVAEGRCARRILYLNVVASVAPMVGLLGTVSGMIGAFGTIGRGGMGRPELLAGDIGEAMITTAAGLIVAIPAMVGYFALRHRLAARVELIEELGMRRIRASGTAGGGC